MSYQEWADDADKDAANGRVVLAARALFPRGGELCCLVLDGVGRRSTRALRKAFPRGKVYVVERDPARFALMRGPRVFLGTLGSFLRAHPVAAHVRVAFFDYCASWFGNADVRPKEDIAYFLRTTLQRALVLATTVCVRACTGETVARIAREFVEICREHGFRTTRQPVFTKYKRPGCAPMMLMVMSLVR